MKRLVTLIFSLLLKPSSWFSSSSIVRCTSLSPDCSPPNLFVPMASSSSIKMIAPPYRQQIPTDKFKILATKYRGYKETTKNNDGPILPYLGCAGAPCALDQKQTLLFVSHGSINTQVSLSTKVQRGSRAYQCTADRSCWSRFVFTMFT